jgi:hypothetical protein
VAIKLNFLFFEKKNSKKEKEKKTPNTWAYGGGRATPLCPSFLLSPFLSDFESFNLLALCNLLKNGVRCCDLPTRSIQLWLF